MGRDHLPENRYRHSGKLREPWKDLLPLTLPWKKQFRNLKKNYISCVYFILHHFELDRNKSNNTLATWNAECVNSSQVLQWMLSSLQRHGAYTGAPVLETSFWVSCSHMSHTNGVWFQFDSSSRHCWAKAACFLCEFMDLWGLPQTQKLKTI